LRVVLKLELLHRTGSFKLRGAFNRILGARVPQIGVAAASGGRKPADTRAPGSTSSSPDRQSQLLLVRSGMR